MSWLASWSRQKEISKHERTAIEMRCLITCLHLSGTYDQLNSPCLASMETVARRIAQIVEAYSGEGGKPRWAGVHHNEGRTSAMDCIDPNLRAPRSILIRICGLPLQRKLVRNWTLNTSAASSQGDWSATGAGDGADREGTFAAKGVGRQRRWT